jgi:hypothetical protein
MSFAPGLSHTRTPQTVSGHFGLDGCTNGEQPLVQFGTGFGRDSVATYPPRPLGCSVSDGGAGPDHPDQTPILIGSTDQSLRIDWSGGTSYGRAKLKSGGAGAPLKLVFTVVSGTYAPPPGHKTKRKGSIAPAPTDTHSCANDANPATDFTLSLSGSVIVKLE